VTAAVATAGAPAAGWLRNRTFDLNFIVGIAALGLVSGWAAMQSPVMFGVILLLDLWLLGYHHVISTFTRLCFDRQSLRRHWFLVFGLPPLVALGVIAAAGGIGIWVLATVYLYWQWFHYTRQSYGVAQIYRRKAGGAVIEGERLAKAVFYAVPVWGILYRSNQGPEKFLGLELKVAPVPDLAVDIAGAVALAMVAWWVVGRVVQWRAGRLPVAHTVYMLSHFTIFAVAYGLIESIDIGWLVVNVWHNAQYILFVWMYNNNRFDGRSDPSARFLSAISQSGRMWLYLAICFALSTLLYMSINSVVAALPLLIIVYQTINFHHYVVDGVIWKVRRKSLQKTLGLTA
jgi:hypothetical protein